MQSPQENPDSVSSGNFTFDARFPGQFLDAETGLFHNGYRDYDPKVGRYIQSDPIGLDGGWNTYGYVEGNPVSGFDPLGLSKRDEEKIKMIIQNSVNDMTAVGLRHPVGVVSNILQPYSPANWVRSWVGLESKMYKECNGQTEFVLKNLRSAKYDDEWDFQSSHAWPHTWGVAIPVTGRKDTPVWFDARADQISAGKPCRACYGAFGNTGWGRGNISEVSVNNIIHNIRNSPPLLPRK